MTEVEIERMIIETLQQLQTGTGEPACEMTPATAPLSDLGFFDSLLAIETTLALEEQIGCSCNEDSVFRSKDGAASWSAVNSGLTALSVNSLAIDPHDPSTVYAGTQGGGVVDLGMSLLRCTPLSSSSFALHRLSLEPASGGIVIGGWH